MRRVVIASSLKQLKKPGHANRPERLDEGFNSNPSQLGKGRAAAIDRLDCRFQSATTPADSSRSAATRHSLNTGVTPR